jgi:hypothetical protein
VWLGFGLLLAGCAQTTPEQQLRESIDDLQAAIDARDAGGLGDWLADDFIGPDGLDRQGAIRLARLSFLRYRDVGVRLGPLDVQMQPQHARVQFTAALTGGSGGLLPESARLYRVGTGWRLEDGEWRLTSAEWEPI